MAHYLKTELYDLIKKDDRIFEFIQEGSLDGLWYWDIENPENEWMNRRFWEVLGYNPEEMLHKTSAWQEIVNPEDLSVAMEALQAHIANPETPYDQQLRYNHKDGSVVWIRCRGMIIRDDEDKPVRMLGAHQDITSLKQSEEKLHIEQQQLKKNEELFRFITENTTDVIRYQSPSGEFEYISPNIKELTGYSSEEYIKFGSLENVFPEDYPILKQAVEKLNAGEKTLTVEYRLYHKTRKVIWVQSRLKAICNKEGQPHSLLSNTNDITHQKQLQIELEQSEEKYKAMYFNAPLAFQSLDIDGNILEVNPQWLKTLGYAKDEVTGKWFGDFLHPEYVAHFNKNFPRFKAQGSTSDVQFRMKKKDGYTIYVSFEGCIGYTPEGDFKQTYCTFKDITTEKAIEVNLKKSEEKLKEAQAIAQLGNWEMDVASTWITFSDEVYQILEIDKRDGITFNDYMQFINPKDHDAIYALWDRLEKNGKSDFEYRLIMPDKSMKWISGSGKTYFDKEGKAKTMFGTLQDITKRKTIELDLIQKQYHLENAQVLGKIGSWDLDIAKNTLTWTDENYRIFGVPIGTPMTYELFLKNVHPDDREYVDKKWNAAMRGEDTYDINHRLLMDNGEVKWVREKAELQFDDEGKCVRGSGFTQDITERKKAEQLIQNQVQEYQALNKEYETLNEELKDALTKVEASERKIKSYISNAPDGVFVANEKGHYIEANPAASEITGYTNEELLKMSIPDILQKEEVEKGIKHFKEAQEKGIAKEVLGFVTKTGENRFWQVAAVKLSQKRFLGFVKDITKQKLAEEKTKDSLNLLNSFINNFPDDVWAKDRDGRMTLANQFVKEKVFGRDDVVGKTVYDFFPQKLADEYWKSEKDVLLNDETTQTEELIPQSDGMQSKILTKFPLHDVNGEVIGLGAIAHNITKRKKAEIALKQSEEKFRGVFEDSNVGIAIGSAQGDVIEVNEEYLKITGYSRDEFVNLNFAEITHPDDLEKELSLFEQLHKGEINNYRIEKRLKAKSGKYVWLDCAITGRTDENDNIDQTLAIIVDINEGKKATETVNVFFDLPMNIHLIGTIEGEILKINTGWEEILGYTKEETIGKNIFDFIHPDDIDSTHREISKLSKGQSTFYFENKYKHKNGNYITLAWSAIFNTTAKRMHGIAKDITQQKAFHEALLQSEEKYKALSENAKHIILTHNFDGEITYANKYGLDFIGLTKEKVIGTDIKLMVQEEEDLKKMQHRINDFISGDFKVHQYELTIKLPSGEKRILEVVGSPLKLDNKVDSILVTAYDITERKAAEEHKHQKLLIESLISQIATNFIQSEDTNLSINQAFEALGTINKASRIYLFQIDEFNGTMSNTHEWCNEGVTAEIKNLQNIPVEDFRWWMNKMHQNEVINIPDVSKMPSEAADEKIVLEQQDIHSLLVIPIFISNKLFGYVGFDNIVESKEWNSTDVYLLEMLASILSNAIARKIAKQNILEQNEEFETLNEELRQTNDELFTTIRREEEINDRFNKAMEATSDGLWDWDLVTHAVYYSPRWKAMLGYRVDELPNDFSVWEDLTYPDDVKRSWKKLNALIDGKEEKFDIEFKMKHKKGHWVDINSRANVFRNNKGKAIRVVGTHSDITERKIAENKLRESEESLKLSNSRYIKAEEMGKVGNWEYIIETDEFWASNESKRIYGFDLEDKSFTTEVVESCIPERERVHQALIDLIEHNKPYNLEFDLIAKNTGERKTITSIAELVKDENGNPRKIVGVIQDITERKIAENKLRESEEKLRLAIDNSPLGITINDMNGNYVSVNKAYEKIVGYTKDELKKMNFYDLTHPDYLPKNRNLFDKMASEISSGFTLDKKYIHKNGNLIDVRIHAGSIVDKDENTLFGMAFTEDITERKALEQKNSMLSKAIDSSPVIVVITNKDGDIEYVNPFFTKTTGYSIEEVIGQNPRFLQSGNHPIAYYKELWQTILSGKTWVGEFQNKKKDGALYWENAAISPIVNSTGEIVQFVAVKEDITELKQTLLDLQTAKEKAEEANALKTEFLHNMSHEIRTPMNGIMGFSNLLCELDGCTESQKNYSQIIHNSSSQLLCIIDDILEISTLETKQLSVQESEIDLNQFTMELFSIYDLKSKERNLPLYVTKGLPSGQCTMLSDKVKLNKIITNLLDNAFKFTNTGKIEFGYKMDLPNIVFFVRDTGVGISSDKMSRIFDRFSQESAETAQTYGGLGLGLSIAKENTELLGGNIRVESEKNVGTTFSVEIPYTPSNGDADTTTESTIFDAESTDTLQILVAEDEETNYLYFKAILEDFSDKKIKLHHAIHGSEAVSICLNNKAINLVLMDIKMPVMDGYQATQLIKEKRPDLPIIAQTAYSTASEREMALNHGCDDFISKPIKKEDLLQLIDKYTNK